MKFEDMINQVVLGDCLEVMKDIPDKSIDMILCDLPYGTTQNQWDSVIPLEILWEQYSRISKINSVIALTACQPFTSSLVHSNLNMFKYEWVWIKDNGTGFLNSKIQPLRNNESVLIFYKKQPTYNPQMRKGKPYKQKSGATKSSNYGKQMDIHTACENGERYPLTAIFFTRDKNKLHPTQKPVALFEYLIKTYTNEGGIVLDNCSGSGTSAIASINTKRNYICIEKDENYVNISRKRILDMQPRLL